MIVVPSWLARPTFWVFLCVILSWPLRPTIRVLFNGEADDLSRLRGGCEQLTDLFRLLSQFQVVKVASLVQ